MNETPKNETSIAELSGENLRQAIEAGQQNLASFLIEVEKNPDIEKREIAKEQAHQQLEAILIMLNKQGEETRKKIAELKNNEDDNMDSGRFVDTWRNQNPE